MRYEPNKDDLEVIFGNRHLEPIATEDNEVLEQAINSNIYMKKLVI